MENKYKETFSSLHKKKKQIERLREFCKEAQNKNKIEEARKYYSRIKIIEKDFFIEVSELHRIKNQIDGNFEN